jgi:hypothetical protein
MTTFLDTGATLQGEEQVPLAADQAAVRAGGVAQSFAGLTGGA